MQYFGVQVKCITGILWNYKKTSFIEFYRLVLIPITEKTEVWNIWFAVRIGKNKIMSHIAHLTEIHRSGDNTMVRLNMEC